MKGADVMKIDQPSLHQFHEYSPLEPFASTTPLVVGSLEGSVVDPATISAGECDLVELRLDGWTGDCAAEEFAKKCSLPVLITARDPAEGGKGVLSQEARAEALRAHFSGALAIDLEIANLESMSEVWEEAKEAELFRVASAHDFEKPMPLAEMLEKATLAEEAGADVVKFAFRLHERADLAVGLELLKELADSDLKVSVMGMGELGPESRVLYALNGSILNYGYLGTQETAPGQMAARELKGSLL